MVGRIRRPLIPLVAVVLVALGVGCFTHTTPATSRSCSRPAASSRTHAKPRGRLLPRLRPEGVQARSQPRRQVTAPLGSQIVLVATVYDKDGQPRRNRRVEWMSRPRQHRRGGRIGRLRRPRLQGR